MKVECVAIKNGNGKVWSLPRPARHNHVIRKMHDAGAPFVQRVELQGFMDSAGRFLGRVEAADLAIRSGQIEKLHVPPNLYSEDLW